MTCFAHIFQDQTEKSKLSNFGYFLTLLHTLWECQEVHKTHNFELNDPIVPDWASRCIRKTNSQHCKSSLSVTLVSVSTPLFKQEGRKRGDDNCRSEVRGHVISRDLSEKKTKKNRVRILWKRLPHNFGSFDWGFGCSLFPPQTSKKLPGRPWRKI